MIRRERNLYRVRSIISVDFTCSTDLPVAGLNNRWFLSKTVGPGFRKPAVGFAENRSKPADFYLFSAKIDG
jgi:hypothetical protein